MKQFEFMGGVRAPSQESWPILPPPFAAPPSLRSSYPIKFSSAFPCVLLDARLILLFCIQVEYLTKIYLPKEQGGIISYETPQGRAKFDYKTP